jgi:TonB-dependent starch-binding outer membrane protein SusC
MKKKSNQEIFFCLWKRRKILLTMKMLLCFVLFSMLNVSGSIFSQSATFNLAVYGKTVKEVFKDIESQSDFRFLYNDDFAGLNRVVSINIKNNNIDQVLNDLLVGADLTYRELENELIVITPLISSFQQITVAGMITDASTGEPLPGVNIIIRGTSTGVVSGINGEFQIDVASSNDILEFSYVGYAPQQRSVGDQRTINVQLARDLTALDEIQVIGYGAVRRSTLTGAISRVQMETVQPVATQRVDQMLQGQTSGLLVLNTDSSPGGNTIIRIRGMNSIRGDNSALIVIDGFQGGDLQSLNPRDVESVEILKDAAATAIYGAQGANGVILIETKKGRTDKPVINYSSELGMSLIDFGKIGELMSPYEFALDVNAREMADNYGRTPVPIFSDAELETFRRGEAGTNWTDVVFRPAMLQTHQLSFSGRTENINYYVSGSILDQEGVVINSGFSRYALRTNINAVVTDWFNIGVNWDYSDRNQNGAIHGSLGDRLDNPILGAFRFAPTVPVYDEQGKYTRAPSNYGDPIQNNPKATALETTLLDKQKINTINLALEFKISEGLTFRPSGGARITNRNRQQFWDNHTFWGAQNNGRAIVNTSDGNHYQNSNVLTYDRDFDRHHINAVLVGEIKYSDSYYFQSEGLNYAVQDTRQFDLGGANLQYISSSVGERTILSGVTRVNYSYDRRYNASVSYRSDGSSVFGAANKWANFPSASLGWRISEEDFMADVDIINNLMLRASWGITGSQAIGNYQTLARMSTYGQYPYDGGGSANLAFRLSSASNPNLRWESTEQWNFGLDLSLFAGRLRLTAEHFDKVTSDLLMPREIPSSTGLTSIIDNVGSIGNKGWEFTIDGDTRTQNFHWSSRLSFTTYKTTVLDLGGDEWIAYAGGGHAFAANFPFLRLTVGEPWGQIIGVTNLGTWNLNEAEEAARYGQMPGDTKYLDVNNDGYITYPDDFQVVGNTMPDFIYGFNNTFGYRNWQLTFLLQGAYGNDIFNVGRIGREDHAGMSKAKLNRWTPENQNTNIPAMHSSQYRHDYVTAWNAANPDNPMTSSISFPSAGNNLHTRWIEDASYLRVKNVTLGYTFRFSEYISNLRVYATGTNLLTFTKFKGFDPEISSYSGSDAQLGTDFNNYPNARMFSLGINVTF